MKYPCNDTRCTNTVTRNGDYCADCRKQEAARLKQEQKLDRQQYVTKNEGLRK